VPVDLSLIQSYFIIKRNVDQLIDADIDHLEPLIIAELRNMWDDFDVNHCQIDPSMAPDPRIDFTERMAYFRDIRFKGPIALNAPKKYYSYVWASYFFNNIQQRIVRHIAMFSMFDTGYKQRITDMRVTAFESNNGGSNSAHGGGMTSATSPFFTEQSKPLSKASTLTMNTVLTLKFNSLHPPPMGGLATLHPLAKPTVAIAKATALTCQTRHWMSASVAGSATVDQQAAPLPPHKLRTSPATRRQRSARPCQPRRTRTTRGNTPPATS
jgi:hypothetical protein